MAKIPLIIDKNYCFDWGVWEGTREFLANAKDADEDGHAMTVEHFPRTSRLEITSARVHVDPAKLFILGKTDKRDGSARGRFGEGFVTGSLALLRKGCDVSFRNGDLSWTCSFEEPDAGHPLTGNELMTWKSRQLSIREQDFRVTIENIDTAVWDVLKKLFLFITPPSKIETIETSHGTLLLNPAYEGQVFSRGIFVRKFDNLSCGYDMNGLTLDRDRRFVNEWDLHYLLGKLWQDACATHPARASARFYEMVVDGKAEVAQAKYHADEKMLKDVRDRYEKEHGADSVPVGTMAQAKDVEEAGGKPTMVNDVLKELLEKGGLSVETAKKALEGQIEARFTPHDLAGDEQIALARLLGYVPEFIVVSFKGKSACRLIDEDKKVGLDRRLLGEPFNKALKALVNQEAKRRQIEAIDVLIEHAVQANTPTAPANPSVVDDGVPDYPVPNGPKTEIPS